MLAAAWVAAKGTLAFAQNRPRIGFITLASLSDPRIALFRTGMQDLGYVEGNNITIDWRSAEGDAERLGGIAQALARSRPALIVAAQTQAISAAKRAAGRIPIVFVATPDPVSSGFVNSLSRPGGNLTGLSTSAADLGAKQVELLRATLPRCTSLALVANPTNNASVSVRRSIVDAVQAMKLQVISLDAQSVEELAAAVIEAKKGGADAAVFAVDGFFIQVRADIAALALRENLPTMFTQREHVQAGGLMSYGPSVGAQYYRAAHYVDRILKGSKPAEMPVERPLVYDFVVNLKTAKALGLTVPQSVLTRATETVN